MQRFLEVSHVLYLHKEVIDDFGGIHGTRDENLLDSAVNVPRAAFGGEYLHKTIPAMAAAYAFHLCQNHPFLDGNKRIALSSSVAFLEINGYELPVSKGIMSEKILSIASGKMNKDELTSFYEEFAVPTRG